jgi:hypothetical protein
VRHYYSILIQNLHITHQHYIHKKKLYFKLIFSYHYINVVPFLSAGALIDINQYKYRYNAKNQTNDQQN